MIQALSRLHLYVTGAFKDIGEPDPLSKGLGKFFKWFFDVIKNYFALVAVRLAADRTHSLLIAIIYTIGLCVISLYIIDAISNVIYAFAHGFRSKRLPAMFFLFVFIPLTLFANTYINRIANGIIGELASLQENGQK